MGLAVEVRSGVGQRVMVGRALVAVGGWVGVGGTGEADRVGVGAGVAVWVLVGDDGASVSTGVAVTTTHGTFDAQPLGWRPRCPRLGGGPGRCGGSWWNGWGGHRLVWPVGPGAEGVERCPPLIALIVLPEHILAVRVGSVADGSGRGRRRHVGRWGPGCWLGRWCARRPSRCAWPPSRLRCGRRGQWSGSGTSPSSTWGCPTVGTRSGSGQAGRLAAVPLAAESITWVLTSPDKQSGGDALG